MNEVSLFWKEYFWDCFPKLNSTHILPSTQGLIDYQVYYFGVKLHALAFQNSKQLPHPESTIVTSASENDLTVFKENWATIQNRTFFGDKIYINKEFFEELYDQNNSEMLTHRSSPSKISPLS